MMTGNQQPPVQRDQSPQSTATNPSYAGATPTSTVSQPAEPIAKTSDTKPIAKTNHNGNPALTRALVGGLIGATVGSLAGALAGQRTSTGFKHAVRGVGNAFKTVGSGLNQTGKGLGSAVKSVGEGVSYVVVGGTVDTAKGIADGAMQAGVVATDAVQTTANKVNEVIQDTADSVKAASETANQSIASTAEMGKELASDADASLNQEMSQSEAEIEAAQISDQENPFPSVTENQPQTY